MNAERNTDTIKDDECFVTPATDIYETDNEYSLRVEMPGVSKNNLEIVLEKDELEIKGAVGNGLNEDEKLKYSEYSLHNYYRKFRIGEDVDRNAIDAKLENGVLTLTLNKSEEVKPRRIEITTH